MIFDRIFISKQTSSSMVSAANAASGNCGRLCLPAASDAVEDDDVIDEIDETWSLYERSDKSDDADTLYASWASWACFWASVGRVLPVDFPVLADFSVSHDSTLSNGKFPPVSILCSLRLTCTHDRGTTTVWMWLSGSLDSPALVDAAK